MDVRTFIVTSNAPMAQAGPTAAVMARTPHKAAELFARRFAGHACHPLRDLPAREDSDGNLWRNWRAEVAHPGDVPQGAPAVLFIREQIGWTAHRHAHAGAEIMSRDYTPHQWVDYYTTRAYGAQVDADNHTKAAELAEADGKQARAAHLRSEAAAHQEIANKYRASATRSARLAERMDDQRLAYGRAMREGEQQ